MKVTFVSARLTALLLLTFLGQLVSAQTLKEFFNSSEVSLTYLGIDFTQAKLYNDMTANTLDIRNRLYASINQVVVNEPKRYPVGEAFVKSNVTNDLRHTLEKNNKIDAEKIIEMDAETERLKRSNIESIIKGYDFKDKKGVGLIFIMENMNKATAQASMYVTLINMGTKKVLLTERMIGKAGGIGFRNYWAKTINAVVDEIKKAKYKEWKAKEG
ncbi:MAG: hypothetical protein KF746_04225 [Chitinophagaceae bacterium]|nr:hypothetical protein [Chitinophagaceae bacterium]